MPLDVASALVSFIDLSGLAQEEWDLSESQQSFQKKWGKCSWQYFVIGSGYTYQWEDEQRVRWIQLPLSLRQDKEYCVDQFGEDFVEIFLASALLG
jgi:hypothetical protein